MEQLSERKEQILRAVIVEYVSGAEPVPSDLIAEKYELGVRSATVRTRAPDGYRATRGTGTSWTV